MRLAVRNIRNTSGTPGAGLFRLAFRMFRIGTGVRNRIW
jgi:hypothetical protein